MDVCPGCGADVPTAEREAHALTDLLECQHEDTISVEIEGGRKVETCEECGAFRPTVPQAGTWRLPPLVQWLADALGRQKNESLASADVPDFASALLRVTGTEMRARLVEWTHSEQHADVLLALILSTAEGQP